MKKISFFDLAFNVLQRLVSIHQTLQITGSRITVLSAPATHICLLN